MFIGNQRFLEQHDVWAHGDLRSVADEIPKEGKSVVYVAIDGRSAGVLAVSDPIKETSQEAIDTLHKMGLQVYMLTGDNTHVAALVAQTLGIDDYAAEVDPEYKHQIIKVLRSKGTVAMAGDGINDAPSLAAADVGIAMGTGTDVAIESAGVTLVKGDLMGIVKAIRLSRCAMRNIRRSPASGATQATTRAIRPKPTRTHKATAA